MTEQLKQISKDEIKKLPEEIQKAINSVDWAEASKRVGLKYLLTDEEINKLQTEVLLVLISTEYLTDLKLNIEINLGLNTDLSEKIGAELLKQVFLIISNETNKNIRENLAYKNISWDQSLKFIVSGGDYSVFLEKQLNVIDELMK